MTELLLKMPVDSLSPALPGICPIIVFARTLLQTFLADRREGNSPPFIDFG